MMLERYLKDNPEKGIVEIVQRPSAENWEELKTLLHQEVDAELLEAYGPSTPKQQLDAVVNMFGL